MNVTKLVSARSRVVALAASAVAFCGLASIAQADTLTFTWVNTGNNGVCTPCSGTGSLSLTSSAIDSTWDSLVSATSDLGTKTLTGTGGTFTGTGGAVDDLTSYDFKWNTTAGPQPEETLAGLSSLAVTGGWEIGYSTFVGGYILYNAATLTQNATSGSLAMDYVGYNSNAQQNSTSFGNWSLQEYGYFKLTGYSAVPLPASAWLLLSALGALMFVSRGVRGAADRSPSGVARA